MLRLWYKNWIRNGRADELYNYDLRQCQAHETDVSKNRAYTTAWYAYRLHQVRAIKRMNKSSLNKDLAGYNRASHDFDLAHRYQSQQTLSNAWKPLPPPLFPP